MAYCSRIELLIPNNQQVGGSKGALAIALAKEYPSLKLVVQDLPGVVAGIENSLPAELKKKIKFVAHDFFSPQPIEADLYLLRHILHDWPDKYCIRILRQLVGKMKPESRVIVNDAIMSEMKDTTISEYRMMKYSFSFLLLSLL
jgi:chemotaxis methyl-accepting protein methylase